MSDATATDDELRAIESSAVRLLAGREHSRYELGRKLLARCGKAALVEQILDRVEAQGFLDERRFVEAFIDQRCRKGFGPLRIRAELRERGVEAVLVEDALDAAAVDWTVQLEAIAERRFGDTVPGDRRELTRRGRFLEQRGFPPSLIRRYLDRVAA
jgi:regulatory protein